MKIRSVSFDVIFSGTGIVNRDGSTKKYVNNSLQDVLEAKKYLEKPFVSRDCILHEVLSEPFGFKLLSQSASDLDRLTVNMSPYRMLRGNLDATEGATLRRKSSFMMTDAYPTENCDNVYLASHAKGNMGGVFYSEECAKTEQKSQVEIDLSALQFISTDNQLTASALNKDIFKTKDSKVVALWNSYYPHTPFPSVSYFLKGKSAVGSAFQTEGVKLSAQDTANIAINFIESLRAFSLTKKSSRLNFASFEKCTVNTDSGPHLFDSIDDLVAALKAEDFEIVSEYKETAQLFDYSKIVEGIQKNKADSKEEKAALAEAKKAAKKAEKTKDT